MVLRTAYCSVDAPGAWAPPGASTASGPAHNAAAAVQREHVLRSSLSNTDLEALFRKGGGDGMGEGTAVGTGAALCDPKCGPAKAAPAEPNSGLRLPDNVIRKLCNVVSGAAHRDDSAAPTSRQQIADSSSGACPEGSAHSPRRATRASSRLSLDLPGAAKCAKRILLERDRIREGAAYHMKKSTSTDSLSTLDQANLAILQESLTRAPQMKTQARVPKVGPPASSSQPEQKSALPWLSATPETARDNALPWLVDPPETDAAAKRQSQSSLPPVCSQGQRQVSLYMQKAPEPMQPSYSTDERKVNLNASLSSKLGKSNKAQEELFFRLSRARQTMDFVKRQYQRFGTLDRSELTIFEALAKLDTVHEFEANMLRDDASDIPLTQLEHAFQTAEILREAHPKDDWLHLVGLIHGLGKLLRHADFGMEPEWSVFGEAFPVGCRFSEMIKHSQLFYANPDRRNRQHNSLEGIYTPGCGLHEVNLSWSAAEYLYLVLYLNGTDFPGEALYCIRYQRFDSMVAGAYKPLMSPEDWLWLPWLKKLRAAAAYKVVEPVLSRVRNESCMREMQTYYQGLIEKYIGSCRLYW